MSIGLDGSVEVSSTADWDAEDAAQDGNTEGFGYFQIVTPKRIYHLRAKSEEKMKVRREAVRQ